MDELIYKIPLHLLPVYQGKLLIVRANDAAALVAALESEEPERIAGVQLTVLDAESEALHAWAPELPVELLMVDPAVEFPFLYRHTNLLDNHPVQVVIPVRPGFGKAVKVAVALEFAVRLEVEQPEPALIEELATVLEFYLRQSTVAQPIEYFQASLLGFYHDDPVPLWIVQDEDPSSLRYVSDDGAEWLSRRLAGVSASVAPEAGLKEWMDQVLATAEECRTCEFLQSCGGYFKWPRRDYDCAGVKRLFGLLRDAASELHRDLDSASA